MSSKLIGLVLLLLVLPTIGFAQERYLIGYAGFAGFQVSMWAVQDLGLLKKYGLEGETVLVPGTSRQIQALIGDSIQFAHVDAAGHVRAVMRGADIVMVGGSLNKFPFSLVTAKEIRQPADLIGKKIGIVGFGGGNDLAVTLLLREWKIPRDKVTVLQAGGGANRLVALTTKALDATVLSHPELGEALRMGMNELGNLNDFKTADYPMSAVAVRRSFMAQNRGVVKRFSDGLRRGHLPVHEPARERNRDLQAQTEAGQSEGSRRDLQVFRSQVFFSDTGLPCWFAEHAGAGRQRESQARHQFEQIPR